MTTLKKRMVLSLALGGIAALALSSMALATHPRPGGGTPFRVPLVPAFKECKTPNSTHVAPLPFPSCTPPVMQSTLLTQGAGGAATNSARLDVICTDAQAPPCTPNDGNDTEDVKVSAAIQDVRCVGVSSGCSAAGADYTSQLIGVSKIRITDHANGTPPTPCTTGGGASPCVTATMQDIDFALPISCADNGAANGANCTLNTTIDTLVPTTVKEFQRAVISVFSLHATDKGVDGSLSPGGGFTCPPICGSGDETTYQDQGIFIP